MYQHNDTSWIPYNSPNGALDPLPYIHIPEEQQALTNFGYSVTLNAEGTVLSVGAPGFDSLSYSSNVISIPVPS